MLKKILSLVLVGLLACAFNVRAVSANAMVKNDELSIEKVKRNIDKLGVGEKARATVKLKSGTKLKGYVYQAGENDFVIADAKTGQKTTVAYSDVQQVKGKNLSTGVKIAIGVGIGAAAVIVLMGIAIASIGLGML